jgi:4-methyl-5(b-hydroxyethyl)-thiazole monophosphate biosynthesis
MRRVLVDMKTIILMVDGFEEIEAITVIDILRRADVTCDICSVDNKAIIVGAHNISVKAEIMLNDLLDNGNNKGMYDYDAVILPGGMPGSVNLRDNDSVINIIREFDRNDRIIAAICAAPIALERAGLTRGRKVTSYPNCLENEALCNYTGDMVSQDKNIITGRAAGAAAAFAYKILDVLEIEELSGEIKKDMFF